jgi:hypothetical protein
MATVSTNVKTPTPSYVKIMTWKSFSQHNGQRSNLDRPLFMGFTKFNIIRLQIGGLERNASASKYSEQDSLPEWPIVIQSGGISSLVVGIPSLVVGIAILTVGIAILAVGIPILAVGIAILAVGIPISYRWKFEVQKIRWILSEEYLSPTQNVYLSITPKLIQHFFKR